MVQVRRVFAPRHESCVSKLAPSSRHFCTRPLLPPKAQRGSDVATLIDGSDVFSIEEISSTSSFLCSIIIILNPDSSSLYHQILVRSETGEPCSAAKRDRVSARRP